MNIVELTKSQVVALYPQMQETFPDDELKPLSRILTAIDQGTYDCIGLEDQGHMLGYAYFVRTGQHLLLDYFSILVNYRNRGLGAAFLSLLGHYFSSAKSVLVEVEDPAFTEDPAEKQLQQRRLSFYVRNGFTNTGVQAFVFGVHYLLLSWDGVCIHQADEVKSLYCAHYRAMLPAQMYQQNIHL